VTETSYPAIEGQWLHPGSPLRRTTSLFPIARAAAAVIDR
jgi:hypothetical protein